MNDMIGPKSRDIEDLKQMLISQRSEDDQFRLDEILKLRHHNQLALVYALVLYVQQLAEPLTPNQETIKLQGHDGHLKGHEHNSKVIYYFPVVTTEMITKLDDPDQYREFLVFGRKNWPSLAEKYIEFLTDMCASQAFNEEDFAGPDKYSSYVAAGFRAAFTSRERTWVRKKTSRYKAVSIDNLLNNENETLNLVYDIAYVLQLSKEDLPSFFKKVVPEISFNSRGSVDAFLHSYVFSTGKPSKAAFNRLKAKISGCVLNPCESKAPDVKGPTSDIYDFIYGNDNGSFTDENEFVAYISQNMTILEKSSNSAMRAYKKLLLLLFAITHIKEIEPKSLARIDIAHKIQDLILQDTNEVLEFYAEYCKSIVSIPIDWELVVRRLKQYFSKNDHSDMQFIFSVDQNHADRRKKPAKTVLQHMEPILAGEHSVSKADILVPHFVLYSKIHEITKTSIDESIKQYEYTAKEICTSAHLLYYPAGTIEAELLVSFVAGAGNYALNLYASLLEFALPQTFNVVTYINGSEVNIKFAEDYFKTREEKPEGIAKKDLDRSFKFYYDTILKFYQQKNKELGNLNLESIPSVDKRYLDVDDRLVQNVRIINVSHKPDSSYFFDCTIASRMILDGKVLDAEKVEQITDGSICLKPQTQKSLCRNWTMRFSYKIKED